MTRLRATKWTSTLDFGVILPHFDGTEKFRRRDDDIVLRRLSAQARVFSPLAQRERDLITVCHAAHAGTSISISGGRAALDDPAHHKYILDPIHYTFECHCTEMAVVLFVRMRSLSRPWASLLTEAFLITTVAVSAAMAGKTRFIRAMFV